MAELFSAKRPRASLDANDVDDAAEQEGGVSHEEDEALESALRARQADIDDTHAELLEKLREIEAEYELKKRPLYKARGEVISRIPGFWLHCFMQHERVRHILGSIDQDILANLQELEIENLDLDNSGYRIKLHFVENDKFSDKVLTKEVRFSFEEGQPVICSVSGCTPNWIGPDLTKPETIKGGRKRGRDSVTFFRWFTQEKTFEPGLVDALADIIKDQIYLNPLLYLDAEQLEEKWDGENLGEALDHASERLPNGSHLGSLAEGLWNADDHTEIEVLSDDDLRDDDSNANEMSDDFEAHTNEGHTSDAVDLEDDSDVEETGHRDADGQAEEDGEEQYAGSDLEEEVPDYEDGDRDHSIQNREDDEAIEADDDQPPESTIAEGDDLEASPHFDDNAEDGEEVEAAENAASGKQLVETAVNIIQAAPDGASAPTEESPLDSGPPGFEENAGRFQAAAEEQPGVSPEEGAQNEDAASGGAEAGGTGNDDLDEDDDIDDLQGGSLDDLEDHGDIEPGDSLFKLWPSIRS